MTEAEEGRLRLDDTTQWALHRVSSLKIAVLNSQNLKTASSKTRVCNFFIDGSCNSDGHYGIYKHICLFCHKQGYFMTHPEFKCTVKNGNKVPEAKSSTAR